MKIAARELTSGRYSSLSNYAEGETRSGRSDFSSGKFFKEVILISAHSPQRVRLSRGRLHFVAKELKPYSQLTSASVSPIYGTRVSNKYSTRE